MSRTAIDWKRLYGEIERLDVKREIIVLVKSTIGEHVRNVIGKYRSIPVIGNDRAYLTAIAECLEGIRVELMTEAHRAQQAENIRRLVPKSIWPEWVRKTRK